MRAYRLLVVALILSSLCFGCSKRPSGVNPSLHRAVDRGDFRQVRTLLARGADVDAKDESGMTPLQVAAWEGQKGMVDLLLAHGADVDANDTLHHTPLWYALDRGYGAVVKTLVAGGANVNIRDRQDGKTPLQASFRWPDTQAAKLLLAAGADPNVGDQWGRTVLHDAVSEGYLSIAELLLAKGALPDARDNEGLTPLHEAVWENQSEMVELLLAHGADINIRDLGGQTPLHVAATNGFTELFDLLVAGGADATLKDERSSTPLDYMHSPRPASMITVSADGKSPYSVIITRLNTIRRSLRRQRIAFDRVWVPQKQDIQALDLQAAIERNPQTDQHASFRREYVLDDLAKANREYAGFIVQGRKYIFCNLDYPNTPNRQPQDAGFTLGSEARVVIDPVQGIAVRIYLMGE